MHFYHKKIHGFDNRIHNSFIQAFALKINKTKNKYRVEVNVLCYLFLLLLFTNISLQSTFLRKETFICRYFKISMNWFVQILRIIYVKKCSVNVYPDYLWYWCVYFKIWTPTPPLPHLFRSALIIKIRKNGSK